MKINQSIRTVLVTFLVAVVSMTAAAQWFPDLEMEGNAVDDAPGGPPDDWENIWDGTEEGSGFLASVFIPQSEEGILADTTYLTTGSSKDNSDLSNWVLTTNNVASDKIQLQNAYAAGYVCPPGGRPSQTGGITEDECDDGDLIVYVGADRYDTNGTSQMGFWLLRDELIADFTDNRFERSDGTQATHKDGDQLVQVDFVNGGAEFVIRVYRWDGDGETGLGLQLVDTITNPICGMPGISPDVCGRVNSGQIDSPWPYTDKDGISDGGSGTSVIPMHGFFEARINLTRVFETQTSNLGCFSSFMAESRSSAPPTATLKDFALGKFGLCDIEVTKVAAEDNICNDTGVASISYTYTVTNKGGLPLDVTLIDDNGTPGDTADDFDVILEDGATADGTNSIGEYITIAPGDMESFEVVVDGVSGTVTNTVVATGAAGQDSSVTHSAMETVDVNQCKISVTKTAEEEAICEDQGTATYDFSVTNDGTVTLYDITLVDDRGTGAPADDVNLVLNSLPDGTGDVVTSLAAGATAYANDQVLDIHSDFSAGDTVVNQVTATGNSVDGGDVTTEVTATASASVDIMSCSISISKTPDRTQVCNGDADITYDYVITNTGTAPVENLIAIDDNGTADEGDDVMLTLNSMADGSGDVIDSLAANGDMAYASLQRDLGDTAVTVTNIVVANGTSLNGWVIDEADANATVTVETCKLTLKKRVINDDGGSSPATAWTLTAGTLINEAGSDIGNDEAQTSTALALTGVGYDLSESGGPASGYSEGDFTCDGGTLTGQSISIGFGDDVTCTVENNDIAPRLKLVKTVDTGDGGSAVAGDWDLSANANGGDPARDFTYAGDTDEYRDVWAGVQYDLSEANGPDGYTPGSWSCTGGGTQSGNSITLGPDEMATCTINNDDIAPTLKLVKTVDNGDGGSAVADDWSLSASANGGSGSSRDFSNNGGSGVFETVFAGTSYDLAEAGGPSGYTEGDWSCDGGSQSGASITLGVAQNVTCTINNDDIAPTLKLVKTVDNGDGGSAIPDNWSLSATANGGEGNARDFSNAGGSGVFETVFAGTSYDLAEAGGPGGYTEGSWSCDGGSQSGASITLGVDDDVTCTINNDDIAPTLKLVKTVTNDNGGLAVADDWNLHATANGGSGNTRDFSTAGGSGVFETVFAGTSYDLTETDGPLYYTAGDWSCDGGTQSGPSITLSVDEDVTCTINNDDDAPKLTLVKVVVNGANPGGTAVETDWNLSATGTGSEDPASISGDGGVVSGGDFDAGTYDLAESAGPDGYVAGDWSCDGGQNASDPQVTVALGDDITCTITNTAKGRVDITKTSSGNLSAGWTFVVLSGASDSSPGTQEAGCTTDEFGFCDFGGVMFPAGDYAFCETNMLPGWFSELSDDGLYPGNFVPNSTDPNHDNSVICVPFTINVGETVSFVVNNTPPPGGDARTIGFWKNWTACDGNGNQDDVLGLNLPVNLGAMTIDTCPVAVDLLDKRDIANPEEVKDGKKRAGDAAYGLAAQLLAYELNQNAGAGTCTAASDAAFAGHILLVTINFDGTGNKLKGKNARANAALATEYAGILDSYNNNTLCVVP